ncbi:uncharacterized protein [Littorina saxatilis]|uniref:Uncharacterized protein n=1 Tax=Littorina saxatilis TaxID=31220 RepID=A0AAN9FXC8_9CAEN
MIRLVFLLRTSEEVKDCLLFNKHLAPYVIGDEGAKPTFWFPLRQSLPDVSVPEENRSLTCPRGHKNCKRWRKTKTVNPFSRVRDIVYLEDLVWPKPRLVVKMNEKKEREIDFKVGDSCWVNDNTTFESFIPTTQTYISHVRHLTPDWQAFYFTPSAQCTMLVNGHLAACMMKAVGCTQSQRFRRHLFKNLNRMKKFTKHMQVVYPALTLSQDQSEVNVTYLIDIVSVWPEQRIDYAWGWYVNYLLTRRMLLEEAMAWLSTLGGAHSSLGEYFTHHAEMAGKISMKQLKLAVNMGDPLTVARCHMFWAYSLLQRGFTRKATAIVRRMYRFASRHTVRDTRLINMCLAAWTRLQYLHRRQVQERKRSGAKSPGVHKTPSAIQENGMSADKTSNNTSSVQSTVQPNRGAVTMELGPSLRDIRNSVNADVEARRAGGDNASS